MRFGIVLWFEIGDLWFFIFHFSFFIFWLFDDSASILIFYFKNTAFYSFRKPLWIYWNCSLVYHFWSAHSHSGRNLVIDHWLFVRSQRVQSSICGHFFPRRVSYHWFHLFYSVKKGKFAHKKENWGIIILYGILQK